MLALLIEDNLMTSLSLQAALRALGYQARVAGGAEEALAVVGRDRPDLVIVSLTSQRFDGPRVVADLRVAGFEGPLLGYAGHVEREFFAAGKAAGADLVAPNSAMRKALPEVLAALARRRAGETEVELPEG